MTITEKEKMKRQLPNLAKIIPIKSEHYLESWDAKRGKLKTQV
ncbi:MAG: hypothetical protein QXT05_01055 [Candidatus Bilamarchaeaceae archaeon]